MELEPPEGIGEICFFYSKSFETVIFKREAYNINLIENTIRYIVDKYLIP